MFSLTFRLALIKLRSFDMNTNIKYNYNLITVHIQKHDQDVMSYACMCVRSYVHALVLLHNVIG